MLKNVTMRRSILGKTLVLTLLPVTIFIFAMSANFYYQARRSLEQEMGRRLIGVARSAAAQIDPVLVLQFAPGDETSRAYRALLSRLGSLAEANAVERVYVADFDHLVLFDTDKSGRIGQTMYRLAADRREIQRIKRNRSTASTMFSGEGGRLYKAGYAPLLLDGEVVGVVGVDAGVSFFDQLKMMQRSLMLIGVLGILSLATVSVLFAQRLVRPIRSLAESAKRIGEGDLTTDIEPESRDEIGFLAATLNQMRLRIVERDRYLQMLQRGIAHEVRNPLGGMELYCDILADELKGQQELVEHVDKIRREVKGLDAVVKEFLAFTRETVPDLRPVKVREFLAELLLFYAVSAEEKGIRIRNETDPQIDTAVFDPDLLRRALHNLLLNAVQAMPHGGDLTVRVTCLNRNLEFCISDTGVGIPDKVRETFWTPFVTTKDSGTGLGLPFVRKIILAHEGQIDYESEQGRGTTIRFTLPQPDNEGSQ
ncbi:MAG TPA: HAMP domain-containing sensor histidine kinase [bacterium]|nr:HAMP domain-containing sensor histidine kinase [bacterium]